MRFFLFSVLFWIAELLKFLSINFHKRYLQLGRGTVHRSTLSKTELNLIQAPICQNVSNLTGCVSQNITMYHNKYTFSHVTGQYLSQLLELKQPRGLQK